MNTTTQKQKKYDVIMYALWGKTVVGSTDSLEHAKQIEDAYTAKGVPVAIRTNKSTPAEEGEEEIAKENKVLKRYHEVRNAKNGETFTAIDEEIEHLQDIISRYDADTFQRQPFDYHSEMKTAISDSLFEIQKLSKKIY